MDGEKLGRLWAGAGGASSPPAPGTGLLGLHRTSDAAALPGAALVVLGLSLDGADAWPDAVRRASLAYAEWLPAGPDVLRVADYGDVHTVAADPAMAFVQAHDRLADIVAAGAAPLVLGDDPVTSVPVLQVLSGKLRGRLGVVAFTPEYEIAPEPAYGARSRWARALELGVLAPANLVLVGGRTAPPGSPARTVLDRVGATVYSLDDVVRDGMRTVAQEALEVATAGTEALYLSVDLAVVAGASEPVGLEARELVAGVRLVSGALLAAADVCGQAAAGLPEGAASVAARVTAEIVAGAGQRFA